MNANWLNSLFKSLRKIWKLIAAIAVLTTIVTNGFGIFDRLSSSTEETMQLTIFLPVELTNRGKLVVDFGNDRRALTIGENGTTNFLEIPKKFKNRRINIELIASEYKLNDSSKKYRFDGSPIYLNVSKVLGHIAGLVQDRKGNGIGNAEILIDTDTTVVTNRWGIFKIDLPENMQKDTYRLRISKKGYEVRDEKYIPLSNDIEISLDSIK